MRRRLIDIPGGSVAGLAFGPPGPPELLFLHANGFNAGTYRAALEGEMRVLALDLRGHGHTTLATGTEGHRWAIHAADLKAVMAALGTPPLVLAGHSMGGTAALLAAPPGMQLALFDPVILPPAEYRSQGLVWDQRLAGAALRRRAAFADRAEAFAAYQGRGAFRTWPAETLRDYLQDGLRDLPAGGVALSCTPGWEAANFAAYATTDPHPALARARGCILRAAEGSTCTPAAATASLSVETIPDTTHFLPMERPEIVRATLGAALTAARSRSL